MKNKLFQLGDSLLRILDSAGDLVLVIDCEKQTMPVWISVSDIALYEPITEENLANVIGNIPDLETLDNEQIRTMHAKVLNYIYQNDILGVSGVNLVIINPDIRKKFRLM